jgi:hypothetical protein
MNDLMNFTDRDTYLAAQRRWSEHHQSLVRQIRAQKAEFKNVQRTSVYPYKQQRELTRLREEIVQHGTLRYDMRREADRQYNLKRQVKSTVC